LTEKDKEIASLKQKARETDGESVRGSESSHSSGRGSREDPIRADISQESESHPCHIHARHAPPI